MNDWILPKNKLPNDGEYITAKFLYMGEVVVEYGKFDARGFFIHDFYSGTGAVNVADIIEWKPRIVTGLEGHPWTGYFDGVR